MRRRAGATVRLCPFVSVESVSQSLRRPERLFSQPIEGGAGSLGTRLNADAANERELARRAGLERERAGSSRESRPGERGELNPPRTLETTLVRTTNRHERATTERALNAEGLPLARHSPLVTEPLRSTIHDPRSTSIQPHSPRHRRDQFARVVADALLEH